MSVGRVATRVVRPVPRRSAGPGPAEPEALAARRRRAVEEPLDVRLRSREPFVDLEVRNPVHRTSYRVLFPEYPRRDSAFCTCTDFARRGLGTCKHLEAGWSWLQGLRMLPELPAAPPPRRAPGELWTEVDRRLDGLRRAGPSVIREVEAVGAVLFEAGDAPDRPVRPDDGGAVRRAKAGRRPPTPTSRARP